MLRPVPEAALPWTNVTRIHPNNKECFLNRILVWKSPSWQTKFMKSTHSLHDIFDGTINAYLYSLSLITGFLVSTGGDLSFSFVTTSEGSKNEQRWGQKREYSVLRITKTRQKLRISKRCPRSSSQWKFPSSIFNKNLATTFRKHSTFSRPYWVFFNPKAFHHSWTLFLTQSSWKLARSLRSTGSQSPFSNFGRTGRWWRSPSQSVKSSYFGAPFASTSQR